MSAADFFAPYQQVLIKIRDYDGRSPLFYRDVKMMAGVFTADLGAVQRMLPDPRLRPLRIGPGRALVAVHCFEYRDSDIGPYNEVSLSLGVQLGSKLLPPILGALPGLRSGHFHGFVQQLPVTTEVALYGGLDFLNYPKYLADISFDEQASTGTRTCSVTDQETGAHILSVQGTLSARHKASMPKRLTMHTYPQVEGVTHEALLKLNLLESSTSFFSDDMEVNLSHHPRADDFRALRLGRQLHYLVSPRSEAILFMPHKPQQLP